MSSPKMIFKMDYFKLILIAIGLLGHKEFSLSFSPGHCSTSNGRDTSLSMGLFDGIAKAFSNQEFKSQDQRVRASHILIKGDDSDLILEKIRNLLVELQDRAGAGDEPLPQVFAELARRESECPSKDTGGDLGMFGKD